MNPGDTLSHEDRSAQRGRRRRPFLTVVLEADRPRARPLRIDLSEIATLEIGRGAARVLERDGAQARLSLPDGWMSGRHALIGKVLGRFSFEDLGSRNGSFFGVGPEGGVRTERIMLGGGEAFECGHTFFRFGYHDSDADLTLDLDAGEPGRPGTETTEPRLAEELELLDRAAQSTVSIMLGGESGTGKELVARAIHDRSGRAGPLVAVNCGALPPNLVEGELFGHRKGAFSGANEDRPGLVRSADRGTLFLDEIGDLPLSAQAAFLRVLEERSVVPIGASRPIPVDLRLVSATHRDLGTQVAEGKFRADLLARLAGFRLTLPSLRERPSDLGLVLSALLRRQLGDTRPGFRLALDAARAMVAHDWPLNMRELDRALAAALALCDDVLELDHIASSLFKLPAREQTSPGGSTAAASPSDDELRTRLIESFTKHKGNVSAVARELGKARMQIQRWCKRLSINPESYR